MSIYFSLLKISLSFALILFFLPFMSHVLALEIGISPPELHFNLSAGERICKNIVLNTDRESVVLSGESYWSENRSKNLNFYKLKAEEFGILFSYPQSIELNKREKIPVCIEALYGGEYYGVLIYKNEEGHTGVGVWIIANSNGNPRPTSIKERNKNGIIRITGFASNENGIRITSSLLFSAALFLFLIIISIFLFAYNKKRKRKLQEDI
jgi:hypothetical protein